MEPKEKRAGSVSRRSSQSLSKAQKMTVMRRDPGSMVARSGWLYKQDNSGMGGMKMWRRRWFILADFCLFYYKDQKEEEVLGSIVLPSYDISTVNPDDKINRKYAFKIEHQGMRTYYISAESYKEMAEWVTLLTNTCQVQTSPSKSKAAPSKGEDEKRKAKHEDAEFGFNDVSHKPAPKKSDPSPPPHSHASTPSSANQKPVANGNNNNAKRSVSSTASGSHDPSSPRQQSRNSQQSRSSRRTTSTSSRTHTSGTTPSVDQRRRNTSEPPQPRQHRPHHRQQPHHDPRLINSYDQSKMYRQQNGQPYFNELSPKETRRGNTGAKVQRHDSMAKLGSWVMNQKQKQSSSNTLNTRSRPAYDTASEMSSASSPNRKAAYFYQPPSHSHRGQRGPHAPSSGKRYKPGSYNDYMDPTEVASSIMSVPPMYRHNRVMSLPRPRSTQELDERQGSRRRRIQNSKSVGYLDPNVVVVQQPTRTKSDHNLPQSVAYVPQREYRPSSHRSPRSVHSPRRAADDVFSPVSPDDLKKYDDRFKFDLPSREDQGSRNKSGYEIKQMDVKGKQGQLRAFAVSMKQPDVIPSKPPQDEAAADMDKMNNNESDIELKLKRLNELDDTLKSLTADVSSLQTKKMRIERSLLRTRTSLSGEGSAIELEEKLSTVKSQLHQSASKLKEMSKENAAFEKEIHKLKLRLLDQLENGHPPSVNPEASKETQRQLEWELGKVQLMMENLNRNKQGLENRLGHFRADDDDSLPSPTSTVGRNSSTKSTELRSPRNVKRISTERRSAGGSHGMSHMRSASSSSSLSYDSGGKYFTLPGAGVSHASSVDSLTAATLMRSSRPNSARTANLHRTKSAAERLLSGSQGNLSQDPDQIKRIQREINQNRRRTLTSGDFGRRTSPRYFHTDTHMQVGIDVQMAIKHQRMPKVLQRAKRGMQRAEAEKSVRRNGDGFDVAHLEYEAANGEPFPGQQYEDELDAGISPHREEDLEPEELEVDLNVTHQTTGISAECPLGGCLSCRSGNRGKGRSPSGCKQNHRTVVSLI